MRMVESRDIQLYLLGPPALVIDGQPARLHSTKTLGLLAYLVLEPNRHSRSKLMALLWGDYPQASAAKSLRQAIYSLRQALGKDFAGCLSVDRSSLALQANPPFWVDAVEMREFAQKKPLSLGDLQHSVDHYRGVLLEGFQVSDAPEFDDWLFFQRDGFEQLAIRCLQSLLDELARYGRHDEALPFARRLLAINPLNEASHRRLMRLFTAVGDIDLVHYQYRQCAEILARELGVEPAQETKDLLEQLKAPSQINLIQAGTTGPSIPLPSQHKGTFVGCEMELDAMQRALNEAMAGKGALVLVAGEGGIGKSTLVHEFLKRQAWIEQKPQLRYLAGRCYEPEIHAPYAMWAEAFNALKPPGWRSLLKGLAPVWIQQLGRLVPQLAPPGEDIQGTTTGESRLRLMQGVVQTLLHLVGQSRLVLFFDDLHWADADSLELLHYVIRQMSAKPLLVIGTYRLEAVDENPQLQPLLQAIRELSQPTMLTLSPMNFETAKRLIEHLGLHRSDALMKRLHQHSGGNPFVLAETVRALLEAGNMGEEKESSLSDDATLPLPEKVNDLITRRTASLDEDAWRALSSAAVIGRPFSVRLLHLVSDLPELRLIHSIETLISRGFLIEMGQDISVSNLSFRHEYLRTVIYEQLKKVHRQVLHGRAAEALLTSQPDRLEEIAEELAYHYERIGDIRGITYLRLAAEQAEKVFAFHHAAQLYNRALALHKVHAGDDLTTRFDLLQKREAIFNQQGRRKEQAGDVAEMIGLAETLADLSRLATAYMRQAGYFAYTHQHERARNSGKRALELFHSTNDRVGKAMVLRELGFMHWIANDYGTALQYAKEALHLHRSLSDLSGEATALHNLAEIYRTLGSPGQAIELFELAQALYWARKDRQRQGLTLYGMGNAFRQTGNQKAAMRRYQQALQVSLEAGDRLMSSRVYHAVATIHWELGMHELARQQMQEAIKISREIGYVPGIAHGLIAQSSMIAFMNDVDAAQEAVQEALDWLRLSEDRAGLSAAQAHWHALEQGRLNGGDISIRVGMGP